MKYLIALAIAALVVAVCSTIGTMINSQQAEVAIASARDNMGDQTQYKALSNLLSVAQYVQWLIGIALILGTWYLLFKRELKVLLTTSALAIVASLMLGCAGEEVHVVTITPPNYAITINANVPSSQVTSNNFGDGELVNLTQVQVIMSYCKLSLGTTSDKCPNIRVAQVPGSPEARIYTASASSGTSSSTQALEFEASGSNGSLDFSVVAIIKKEDAKCYANKMGVRPVMENGKPSVYNFAAIPLADALDTRVVQIASAEFAKAVVDTNPVELAKKKFAIFDATKPSINKVIYERTCITIVDEQVNGGVVWSSQKVQDYIDRVIIVNNELDLVPVEVALAQKRQDAFMKRLNQYRDQYGLDAALRMMELEKWDGTGVPLNRFPVNQPTSNPPAQPAPAKTPTAKP